MRALIWITVLSCIPLAIWRSATTAAGPASPARLPGVVGVVDAADYPSLQAAIDAVPRTGGILKLPPGEFHITEPLVIRHEDLRIEGAGSSTHIHNDNTEGQSAIILAPAQKTDPKTKKAAFLWRVMLSNFRLTGAEKSGHGVEADHVNEIFIQGMTISHHGGDGIHLNQCYEDPRINDNLITYNKKTGLNVVGCHDIVVSGNHFEENFDAVRCVDGFNLCMSGNNVDDHLGNGVVIENTYGSIVSSNMIEECNLAGIVLDRDCYGITLSANVIAHESGGGIDLRDAHGVAVSANTFPLCHQFAVRVGPDSDRITISANAFSDSHIGGDKKRIGGNKNEKDMNEAGGIILDNTRHIAITGNSFSSVRPKALTVLGDCRRVIFQSNILTDASHDAAKLKDSKVEGNLD